VVAAFEIFIPIKTFRWTILFPRAYYCEVLGATFGKNDELAALEVHMREMVNADLPFERKIVPLQEAVAYFRSKGQSEKVPAAEIPPEGLSCFIPAEERRDYHHGYMVPSTDF